MMLRNVNPNTVHQSRPGAGGNAGAPPVKPMTAERLFAPGCMASMPSSGSMSALPAGMANKNLSPVESNPQGSPVSGTSGVVPIPPVAALAEMESIRQRLLQLMQGMSAWNALPALSPSHTYAMDPMGQQATAKLRESEMLLDQCKVLHSLQQQLSQSYTTTTPGMLLATPLSASGATNPNTFGREPNENSQSIPSIFAPPQLHQSAASHSLQLHQMQQQPSCRSTPPSSASRRGISPRQGHTDTETDDADGPRPSARPMGTKREAGGSGGLARVRSPANHPVRRVPWPPLQDCIVAIVEFKRQRMKRCLSDRMIEPSKYVIIPGDRGYDCGLVVQCGKYDVATSEYVPDTLKTMDDTVVDPEELKGDMIPISREATADEIQQLYSTQAAKERLALKRCRELVQRLNLDMTVVDCEYQFDGTKISFYFEADHAVDFRDLNKELYRVFNARIWLENVNGAVKNVVPEGALSKADKAVLRRNGLRIPTSATTPK